MKPQLLIIGYARHGKDTLAAMLCEIDSRLQFYSSSSLAAELFVFEALAPVYGYTTIQECIDDRVNHRAEWFNLIAQYNSEEPARLAIELMERADIYIGMRSRRELLRCREIKLFDCVIWVDAGKRLPPEAEDSCELDISDADLVIDNNGTEEDLRGSAETLLSFIKGEYKDEILPFQMPFGQ